MSVYFVQWLTLMTVFSLAVISPGPDFVMAVRNSIIYSRRAGIFTALGFGLSITVHTSYTVLGIATLISQSILLFNLIKWAGAAYLIYIGIQALRSKGMTEKVVDKALRTKEQKKSIRDMAAFRSGFLTNILNPKATIFFLSIFSQIIDPTTPMTWLALYGLSCAIITILWFSLVALTLNHRPIRNVFLKASKWIDRVCGVLLIGLGIKIALTSK